MSMPRHKPVANLIKQLFCASALAAGTLGMPPAFAQAPPPLVVADKPQVTPPPHDGPLRALTPAPAKMLLNPPESDWLMWRRTYDAWGYSPLKQINSDNVKNLTVAWSWAMTPGATETTPLVHDGVLFLYNFLDKVQALDGTNGELLWEYKRDIPPEIARQNGNFGAKRNIAMVDDKLIVATTDSHIIALDMKTGKLIWDHEVEDYKKGWRYTGGPLVASNVIVQGMTGCGNAMPGGCFITGHDINTGKELWRFHTIAQPGEPGGDSWNGLPLEKRFGASTWNSGSYDPDTDTLFLGVGQPYPHIAEIGGLLPKKEGANNDALYTDATLALDPHTGKLKWYYQHLPNDTWDLDYAYERVLVDIPVDGKVRKALVTVGKLGIIEVLDRTNGQWLWSKQTVYQNVVSAIDPKTGAKTINQAAVPHIGKTTTNCPADPGSRGWPATAYSPRTHMLYIPLNEYCSDTTPIPIEPGKTYTGGSRAIFARGQIPNSDGNIGRMDGVDLFTQKAVWSDRTRAPQTGAALATGGGLVFGGALDRYFRAYDDKTGKVLWQVTDIADVLNYVSNAWDNGKSLPAGFKPFTADEIKALRTPPLTSAAVYALRSGTAVGGGAPATATANGAGGSAPVSFTADQVTRGSDIYAERCVQCHGDALDNGEFGGAPLNGSYFRKHWGGGSVAALVAFMKAKMPPDRPGSLTDQSYAELTAFLLDANDYPKGDKELPPDTPSQQAMSLKRSQ